MHGRHSFIGWVPRLKPRAEHLNTRGRTLGEARCSLSATTSGTGLRSSPFDLKRIDGKFQLIFLGVNKKMANFHRPVVDFSHQPLSPELWEVLRFC